MFFYGQNVLYSKMFLLKKPFFTEKNINENVKNIYLVKRSFRWSLVSVRQQVTVV